MSTQDLFAAGIAIETEAFGRGHWDYSGANCAGDIRADFPEAERGLVGFAVTEDCDSEGCPRGVLWVAVPANRVDDARRVIAAIRCDCVVSR